MRLTRMTMSGAKARMKRLASLDMEHRADALFVSSPRRCLDLSFACHVALSGNLRRSRARVGGAQMRKCVAGINSTLRVTLSLA
jgi:hypothetical protein